MIDKAFLEALRQFGAYEFEHSTRHLSDHLIGTHNLLQSWDASTETCIAGLFHSIYGTKYYESQAVQLPDREKVRTLIGTEAELLVFLFCVTDRREFFVNVGCSSCMLHDARNATQYTITPKLLEHLISIEVANWLEIVPYIRSQLSPTSISRTIELYEGAVDLLPSQAVEDLRQLKKVV